MQNKPKFNPDASLKLRDQMHRVLCYYDYAYRTERIYCNWILRFIKFTAKNAAQGHGYAQIDPLLSYLTVLDKAADTMRCNRICKKWSRSPRIGLVESGMKKL